MNCVLCNAAPVEAGGRPYLCRECGERVHDGRHYPEFLRYFCKLDALDPELRARWVAAMHEDLVSKIAYDLEHKRYLIFEPLPHQKAFLAADAPIKCAFYANQTGKTISGAINNLWDMLGEYPDWYPERFRFTPPTVGRVWVSDFKQVEARLLPQFQAWYPDWPRNNRTNDTWMIRKHHTGTLEVVTHLPTGSVFDICTRTQEDEVAEGWVGHWAHADEPMKRSHYGGTIRGLMRHGGQFRMTATPLTEAWLYTDIYLRSFEDDDIWIGEADIWANCIENGGYLRRESIERLLRNTPEHLRRARAEGSFVFVEGLIYPEILKRRNDIYVNIDAIDPQWEIVSVTDWHSSTPVHTLYMAVTPWDQYVFFDELVLPSGPLPFYVDEMLKLEERWGVKRIKERLVDRSMDRNYSMILDKRTEAYNPYREFSTLLIEHGDVPPRKVTGSEGVIQRVKQLCEPRFVRALDRHIQPFVIGHHCKNLRATLPKYKMAEYKSGPMAGLPKDEADKREADGAHGIDCYDEETEVLTRDGWRMISDVPVGSVVATVNLETDLIEYQEVLFTVAKRYKGDMVRIGGGRGSRLDALVTPNHRMVVYPRSKNEERRNTPIIKLAKDLSVWDRIKLTARWSGEDQKTRVVRCPDNDSPHAALWPDLEVDSIDLAQLWGWFISEGSVYSSGSHRTQKGSIKRYLMISQMSEKGRAKISELLERLPWNYFTVNGGFRISNYQCTAHFEGSGDCYTKRVPQWIKDSSTPIIKAFLESAVDGDGWRAGTQTSYATVSRFLAGDIQELFLKTGRSVRMRKVIPSKTCGEYSIKISPENLRPQFHVHAGVRRAYSLRKYSIAGREESVVRMQPYCGMVYCLTVPNGTLVVRRRGKAFVCGNCMHYALGRGYTWQELKEAPPPPGTVGWHLRRIQRREVNRTAYIGEELKA